MRNDLGVFRGRGRQVAVSGGGDGELPWCPAAHRGGPPWVGGSGSFNRIVSMFSRILRSDPRICRFQRIMGLLTVLCSLAPGEHPAQGAVAGLLMGLPAANRISIHPNHAPLGSASLSFSGDGKGYPPGQAQVWDGLAGSAAARRAL